MKKHLKVFFFLMFPVFIIFLAINIVKAENLTTKLKGKILLQVEQNGEAWYLNPANEKRYFLGRPDDAFQIMRELGVGISNADLEKIPISLDILSGPDSDGDGLPDILEDAIGTDKNNKDTDGDGYDDKTEILGGFDPRKGGGARLPIDLKFAEKQKGKIFLQVETNGEAWYINPTNNKRYFLGRPTDAFNVMRGLGLGISDDNLTKIKTVKETFLELDCDSFPDKLESCEPFSCKFIYPFTEELTERKVIGLVEDKCQYTEEMPNNGRMDCEYPENLRKAMAQYYRDVATAESVRTSVKADLVSGEVETKLTIDGKEVENHLLEALDNGQCIISGYDIQDTDSKCPPGTKYKGEFYTYENEEQVAHSICSDPNAVCPLCENCVTGSTKNVITESGEVCYECQFDKDCKEGFHCFDNSCLNNSVLINNTSCEDFDGNVLNDPCQEYSCETCEKGHMICQGGWSDWPSDIRNRCIECDDSFKECTEGYKCEEYKCVAE